VLLLLSLPVLAGGILPGLNLAVFWDMLNNLAQSAGNLNSLNFLEILRGYTPKYFGYIIEMIVFLLAKPDLSYVALYCLPCCLGSVNVSGELIAFFPLQSRQSRQMSKPIRGGGTRGKAAISDYAVSKEARAENRK
jgi:hypothetical protein